MKPTNGTENGSSLKTPFLIGVAGGTGQEIIEPMQLATTPGRIMSRHDIIPWTHLNLTHVRPLSSVDAEDIQNILNKTILVAHRNNLKYFGLHSVYLNFDAVRGMNYRMHLSFYDRGRLEHGFNSIEVVKPMVKRIEIAPLGLRYAQQRRRGRVEEPSPNPK
ncbi:hypothetical protein quinque_013969 [Culex quinquefasciatus]